MRHHGFLAITAASVAACGAWLLNHNLQLDASEEQSGSFREAFTARADQPAPVEDDDGIRLNYFEAPWDRVLRSVADQSELTLVMDKVPHGRFARRDRTRYEIDSAIRVLNSELEPQGFRVFRQSGFLVVLKLDEVRTRYARPVITEWENAADRPSADRPSADRPSADKPSSGQSADVSARPAAAPARNPFRPASARQNDNGPRVAWATQQNDEPVSAPQETPFGSRVTPAPPQPPAAAAPADGPPVQQTITVRNANAAEVARSIYLVFESRSELIKEGLNGLPTFVVRSSPEENGDAEPLFTVGIDQPNNQLLVEASKARVTHLTRLVNELDKPEQDKAETIRLLPNKGVADATAKDLNDQIRRMVAMRSQPPAGTAESESPVAGEEETPQEGSSLNLRGEVNVQAMQDLGILILKGNEADVEKVTRIIQQLEDMSVGSLPDIHLLSLRFVNSESMAELLTSVYDQLSEMRQRGGTDRKTAAFIPVVQPNSILIVAPAIELDSILQLADQLDQKTDPEAEFRVFSLRNAIASQVTTSIETFYAERGGLGTRVRVVADFRTNAVIAQGRTNDLEEIAKLVAGMDIDEPGAVHRVEIIKLKHATAEELAETINTAIQSVTSPPQQTGTGGFGLGGQGAQELQDTKSVALEFLTASGGGRELLRSGILVDVRVNPDIRSNSLVVSAPEASMPLLRALVAELDGQPSATAEIKVFALQNADAEQSVELLTSMFENQNQEDQLGVQIAGTEGSASSLIPVSFTADLRTNTVLAVGGPEALSVVEAILLRLDTTESRQRRTTVIPLRNVLASDVAVAIETFLDQQQTLRESSADLISNIERLRQEVIVAPDDNSNSLIVEASPEYYSQITQIITELDANPPQVVIQALLVEVQLDNTDEFGVELGFQDPTLFTRSIIATADDLITIPQVTNVPGVGQVQSTQIITQNPTPGFNFNNTLNALGNNASGNTQTVAAQGISNFSLGRQNGDLGFGGFVFSAQSDAVSVLVRALAARRTVHVLSRPQIRTTHNNTASIEVGQQVPIVDGVTVTDNFVTPNITPQNVGIILEVTPRVTPDGTISMEVYAEKSAVAPGGVPVFTDVTTGNVVESVIIDTSIADTTVAVPNGQTIVIGGMITKSDETLERKVPWLGDLPLVGSLFRYDGTNTARTELLIFLTPRIVYSDADSELIKQVEAERMHFIESEAEEIHGPLYSVPPSYFENVLTPMIEGTPGLPIPDEGAGADAGGPVEQLVMPPQTKRDGPEQPEAAGGRRVSRASSATSESQDDVVPTADADADPESKVVRAVSQSSVSDGSTKEQVKRTSWFRRMIKGTRE
ncbi:MAG: secretin N-terminal domain-containing protein [Fuerstiella sp.]